MSRASAKIEEDRIKESIIQYAKAEPLRLDPADLVAEVIEDLE